MQLGKPSGSHLMLAHDYFDWWVRGATEAPDFYPLCSINHFPKHLKMTEVFYLKG